jgi:hypothetical protein
MLVVTLLAAIITSCVLVAMAFYMAAVTYHPPVEATMDGFSTNVFVDTAIAQTMTAKSFTTAPALQR